MLFEFSPKVRELESRLRAFMDEHIYPNESVYSKQIAAGDRWQPTAIIEELKPKARALGLWNLFLPDSGVWRRPDQSRVRSAVRDHGPLTDGAGGIQLLRAGHRQHGSAGALRHPGAERPLAEAAAGW